MNNIWSVYAVFEDDESTSWILIGNFTDNLIAKRSKEKWLSFFYSNKNILEEPVNWNPKNDDWFEDNEYFNWFDSAEYHLKLSEYKYIKDFQDIFIEEQPLDEDIFTESMPTDSISELAKQFNRDYKIKELIK
jgi:hypothetical protein